MWGLRRKREQEKMGLSEEQERCSKASTTDMLGGGCSSPRRPREGTQGKASEGSGRLGLGLGVGGVDRWAPGSDCPEWQVLPTEGNELALGMVHGSHSKLGAPGRAPGGGHVGGPS